MCSPSLALDPSQHGGRGVTEEPRNGLKDLGWYVTHVSFTFIFFTKVYHVAKTGINGFGEHMLPQDGSAEHFLVTDRDGEAQHASEPLSTAEQVRPLEVLSEGC